MAIQKDYLDELIPEGWYQCTVERTTKYKTTSGTTYRRWDFRVIGDNTRITVVLFPWESEPLLLALGGKKEGGVIIWDDEAVIGKSLNIYFVNREDKQGVKRTKIKDAKPLVEEFIPLGGEQ